MNRCREMNIIFSVHVQPGKLIEIQPVARKQTNHQCQWQNTRAVIDSPYIYQFDI